MADKRDHIDQNVGKADVVMKSMERSVFIRILMQYVAIILLGIAILGLIIRKLVR